MSEESKIDSGYVHMGGSGPSSNGSNTARIPLGLDDPSLSQEDKDLRLAIALQQQENAEALAAAKKRAVASSRSDLFRTGRSGVNTRLAAVRAKDHGQLSVPKAYTNQNAPVGEYIAPAAGAVSQELSDASLAAELHKVEASSIGAANSTAKLLKDEAAQAEAAATRTARSGKQAFHKVRK